MITLTQPEGRGMRDAWLAPAVIGGLLLIFLMGFLPMTGDLATSLEIIGAGSVLLLGLIIARYRIGSRQVAIVGLICSVPLHIHSHLIYRDGYIGAGDGIAVELVDVWMVWLLIDYLLQRRRGELQPARSLKIFYLPLALLLVADILSFANSADLALSVYGLVSHLRAAALFVILAITLEQGVRERRAALIGILGSVIIVGATCITESVLRHNFRANAFVDDMRDGIFRAGAFDTPTGTAAYLAVLLPLVVIAYFYSSHTPRKILAAAALGIGFAGLMCTISRGSTGITFAASIPMIVFLHRKRFIQIRHFILCVAVAVIVFVSIGDKFQTRLDEGSDNLTARFNLNPTAINMGSNSPLVGEGVNNYWIKMERFRPTYVTQPFRYIVHNKFLLTFAESGVLGMAAFVWLVVVGLACSISLARRGMPLGVGLVCSMIALVLTMNVEPYDNGPSLTNLWVILALIAALWGGHPWAVQQWPGSRGTVPSSMASSAI